ncbi:(d)CMP kinase [Haloarchaeobius sp. TZWWS8]|uniref:(d)CMP kinase n=1 Tax=Haloarchaeobius sp. TZWWS8 TaxID=3446121 RepID=UPI003EB8B354
MLLTVSGPPGCGTSTTAKGLADALDLEHVSGGDIFRELAAERDLSLAEFNELAEEDDQIDRDLDRRLREIAVERDGIVLESRLAGWLAGDEADFRFWLDAPVSVRGERIADREEKTPEQAAEETEVREASEATRYHEYYGIDIGDLSIYDVCLNTARWDAETVVGLLVDLVESHDPATDEGAYPVDVDYEF